MNTVQAGAMIGLSIVLARASPAKAEERQFVNTRAEFSKFDPGYRAKLGPLRKKVESLQAEVQALEASGVPARCAGQILTELRWLTSNTADYAGIRDRLLFRRRPSRRDRIFRSRQTVLDGRALPGRP